GFLDPPRDMAVLNRHALFWMQVTTLPAFLAFVVWNCLAFRNARLMASGPSLSYWRSFIVPYACVLNVASMYFFFFVAMFAAGPSGLIGLLLVPVLNVAVAYFNLQTIWRSSDPVEIARPGAWRTVIPSWRIRFWAWLCCAAPLLLIVVVVDDH